MEQTDDHDRAKFLAELFVGIAENARSLPNMFDKVKAEIDAKRQDIFTFFNLLQCSSPF